MNPLVTPAWLADRLAKTKQTDDRSPVVRSIVVLDATLPPVGVTPPVDTRGRYLEKHIPGALFFDIDQLSDHTTKLPHMLPTADEFSRSMSALGIGDNSTIVIYEQEGVFSAPRARWMLRTFGATQVYLLDGGLKAWTDAGMPTQSGPVQPVAAAFHATLDAAAVKDYAQLLQLIAAKAQILDARSAARFAGTAPEPRPGLSSGHMPAATSVPFIELVEQGRLKSAAQLQQLFITKNVDIDQPVTTTCGSGVTAAVIALGLEIAGAKHVTLYDGSWAEYAQLPNSVIEKTD